MKAWILPELGGGVGALRIVDLTDPIPGPREVVLNVEYAALNPADRYLAEGLYPAKPPLPHVLGRDGIGTVEKADPDAGLHAGDQRLILRGETGVARHGTFAERVAVNADSLVPVPPGWTDEQAAGAPLVYLTAYQALMTWGELPPSVVLVTGASGGVGVASVQLAKALGHTVIGLSRDAGKRERLKQLGMDAGFDPTDANWPRQLKEHLGKRRVDVAIDNIAGPLLPQVIDTLGDRGRVAAIGALAGPVPQFNTPTLFFRRIEIAGIFVGAYSREEARAAWDAVLALMNRTGAKPLVDRVFPFKELPAAFDRLAKGPMGKVLLRVGQHSGRPSAARPTADRIRYNVEAPG